MSDRSYENSEVSCEDSATSARPHDTIESENSYDGDAEDHSSQADERFWKESSFKSESGEPSIVTKQSIQSLKRELHELAAEESELSMLVSHFTRERSEVADVVMTEFVGDLSEYNHESSNDESGYSEEKSYSGSNRERGIQSIERNETNLSRETSARSDFNNTPQTAQEQCFESTELPKSLDGENGSNVSRCDTKESFVKTDGNIHVPLIAPSSIAFQRHTSYKYLSQDSSTRSRSQSLFSLKRIRSHKSVESLTSLINSASISGVYAKPETDQYHADMDSEDTTDILLAVQKQPTNQDDSGTKNENTAKVNKEDKDEQDCSHVVKAMDDMNEHADNNEVQRTQSSNCGDTLTLFCPGIHNQGIGQDNEDSSDEDLEVVPSCLMDHPRTYIVSSASYSLHHDEEEISGFEVLDLPVEIDEEVVEV
eukprot:CAMPEP_0178854794 /NCGR_PEP_ID=MMETSP0746-20121128/23039_1 /TAXON_ID=913974 /ORGANISM="Nitzschia punctata, Strain CCMP561" /LENGTH=425 /DNA_ID=CAMNT_0020520837 /DNA_START=136 /DNA_END=1414 /DNA_ORIENTATION=-